MLKQMRRMHKLKVNHFMGYEEGVQYMSNHDCDIVVTNLKLEEGWVSKEEFERLYHLCNHIIVVTGLGDISYSNEVFGDLKFHFLSKPYTKNQFEACLLQVINGPISLN